jgi:hypothetical protein
MDSKAESKESKQGESDLVKIVRQKDLSPEDASQELFSFLYTGDKPDEPFIRNDNPWKETGEESGPCISRCL